MSQALQGLSENIESIPGFSTVAGVYEDVAPDYLKTKNPFYEKVNGEDKRRKPPAGLSEHERKIWKSVMKRAWYHDRNFCNCFPIDLGLGIIPIVSFFPVIGPMVAYAMHGKLVKMCADGGAPGKLQATMLANMATDFLISLCPVLGVLFSWMYGCSTRNAALFDSFMRKSGTQREVTAKEGDITQQAQQRDLDRRLAAARAQPTQPTQPQARAQPQTAQGSHQSRSAQPAQSSPEMLSRGIVHSQPSPNGTHRGVVHSQPRNSRQSLPQVQNPHLQSQTTPQSQGPRTQGHNASYYHAGQQSQQPQRSQRPQQPQQSQQGQQGPSGQPNGQAGHRRTNSQRKPVPSEDEQVKQAMALSLQDQQNHRKQTEKEYQRALRASMDEQVNSGPNREIELAVENSINRRQQPMEPDMRAAISASLRDSGPASPTSPDSESPTQSARQSLHNPYRTARKPVGGAPATSEPTSTASSTHERFQFALPVHSAPTSHPSHAPPASHAPPVPQQVPPVPQPHSQQQPETPYPQQQPYAQPYTQPRPQSQQTTGASAIYGPASMSFPEPESESYPPPNSLAMPEPR